MMRHLLLLLACSVFLPLTGEQILMKWEFSKPEHLKQFYPVNAKGHKVEFSRSRLRAPDGGSVLEIKIIQNGPEGTQHARQLIFPWKTTLKKGERYRISFYARSSVETEIGVTAAMRLSPYSPFARGKSFPVNTKWRRITYEFPVDRTGEFSTSMPRVSYGAGFPVDSELFLGPVTVTRLPSLAKFQDGGVWRLFPNVRRGMALSDFSSIPPELPGTSGTVLPQEIRLEKGKLDLSKYGKAPLQRSEALLFHEFESDIDCEMLVGAAADWWMEISINGKTVFDTLKTGNITQLYTPDVHTFFLPVRKGRNLLAARVSAGSGGWRFAFAAVSRTAGQSRRKFIADKEWKPVDFSSMYVKPGTALDLSGVVSREPAGTFGRVIINRQGKTAFESDPEKPVRFLSYVYHPEPRDLRAFSNAEMDAFADAVARQGYNMIRLHYVYLLLLKPYSGGKHFGQITAIPTRREEIPFDPAGTDRFDYLIAALKKRGIYINLDIVGGNGLFTDANPYWNPVRQKSAYLRLFVEPDVRKNWQVGAEYMLARVNPYTGMRLADDPALVVVEPYNEQEFRLRPHETEALRPYWRKFLREKYRTTEALNAAWKSGYPSFEDVPEIDEKLLRAGNVSSADGSAFLGGLMTDMMKFYAESLRKIGYRGLMTQWDMIMRTMELPVRAMMPAIAQHTYHCHPGIMQMDGKQVIAAGQSSSLNASYLRAAAVTRMNDRPFLITEYSHTPWNRYFHEQGLYFGAYAALQGWDSLAQHRDLVLWKPREVNGFGHGGNPLSRAADVVAALTWLRGDVSASPHLVELVLRPEKLFPKNILSAVGDEYAQLALLTGVGIRYPGVEPLLPVGKSRPDLTLVPDTFSSLAVSLWYAVASTGYGGRYPELVRQLREKSILPADNRTDPAKRIYQSDTGEITLFGREEEMTVIAPRLEGAILKKNRPVRLGRFSIGKCSVPAGITIASLDAEATLKSSGRMLLVVSTRVVNTDMETRGGGLILKRGGLPVLLQTGQFIFTLKNENRGFRLYALGIDGSRREELPVEEISGGVRLNLDTTRLTYNTPFFELVKEQ